MSEIISPTRHQFCLSISLQTRISDRIFYDVSFIKLYHYVHIVVFQRSMWQTSCALCKSKCRLILGKWSFSVLVELALSNLYLFFFLAHSDFSFSFSFVILNFIIVRIKNLYGINNNSNGLCVVRMYVTTCVTNKLQMTRCTCNNFFQIFIIELR